MEHDKIERNVGLMLVLTMLAISVGGMVEVLPLFFLKDTVETVKFADGRDMIRPYSPLEQRGRDIYIREGCYTCHSQMIRPFRDEALRYGHYSLAAESKFDHPFQWGSKRTGPDLARVGGKYSNDWQVQHLIAPRSMVPESVMPNYPWLIETKLDYSDIQDRMRVLRATGVPIPTHRPSMSATLNDLEKMLQKPCTSRKLKKHWSHRHNLETLTTTRTTFQKWMPW